MDLTPIDQQEPRSEQATITRIDTGNGLQQVFPPSDGVTVTYFGNPPASAYLGDLLVQPDGLMQFTASGWLPATDDVKAAFHGRSLAEQHRIDTHRAAVEQESAALRAKVAASALPLERHTAFLTALERLCLEHNVTLAAWDQVTVGSGYDATIKLSESFLRHDGTEE